MVFYKEKSICTIKICKYKRHCENVDNNQFRANLFRELPLSNLKTNQPQEFIGPVFKNLNKCVPQKVKAAIRSYQGHFMSK